VLCAAAAVFAWGYITQPGNQQAGLMLGMGGLLGGLVLGLVITFVPRTAPYLSPVYAVAEGGVLALFSYFITVRAIGTADTGMIFQAVGLTFAIAGGLAVAYSAGLVRVGGTAMRVMIVAGAGLFLYFITLVVCNLFLGMNLPNLWASASPLGIGFTVLCLILASLFLVLDFQFIEAGVARGAPKHMEWYGAFGILVTLVWLYIEVLRLLSKLRND
jgi:uncharacterized YccA/Bax inhibitor family protein